MLGRTPGRRAGRLPLLAMLVSLSTGLWLFAAGPTTACSCVLPGPLAEYKTNDHAIFSGTVGPKDARGVPVRVTEWFWGRGSAPLVYLGANSFGDGASCGIETPVVGTEWIWLAFLPERGGDPVTNLCSPHASLGSPEGDKMLLEARETFGGVAPPGPSDPGGPESASAPSAFPAETGVVIVLLTAGLGLSVMVAAVVIARRRAGVDGHGG